MFKTLGEMVGNRAELLLVELQEERVRLLDALLLLMAGGVCGLMALIMATLTVVVIFWDTHRMLVLTLFILLYLCVAGTAFGLLHSRLRRWRAFAATLDQIKKDQSCFKEKNSNGCD
jgi:uncharacterized membrane protein YqjE